MSDREFRPHILLKNVNDELYWRPYNFEPIEEIRAIHEWELKGQKLYQDKARSTEELERLRQILLATSIVNDFYEFQDEIMFADMLAFLVSKIAWEWYAKDHPDTKDVSDEELAPYHTLVREYIMSYSATKIAAVASTAKLGDVIRQKGSNDTSKVFEV